MNILAVDCALKTGWATLINGRIESGVEDFGAKRMRGESPGMDFIRYNRWLEEMRTICLPSRYGLVVFEQAHLRGGHATNLCVGMTTRAQEFAARIGAECLPVHTGTLKKYAVGSGNAGKGLMMEAFEEATGCRPIDDNHADAYWLLRFAMNEVGIKEVGNES
jgi:hypothetical protein